MKRSSFVFTPSRSAGGVLTALQFAVIASLALIAASLGTTPAHAAPVAIDWVTVGNPDNDPDPATGSLYGAVNYEYRIAKYEVTIQQYTDFLNAVAAADPYLLYNTSMASDLNIAGISRSGTSGEYTYSVIDNGGDSGDRPITYVSWFDAARFANWMHNGQGSGSTETGAYTLVSGQTSGTAPMRNPTARFSIPDDNEWYKAAYYSPVKAGPASPGYYAYATQSNIAPGNAIGPGDNQANYYAGSNFYETYATGGSSYSSGQNYLTDVGAFTNSASFYGTFDQSGNVYEWTDLTGNDGTSDTSRGTWGGAWFNTKGGLGSSGSGAEAPSVEYSSLGFRLTSPVPVPEPSTWVIAGIGIAWAARGAFRHRKRD